VHGHAHGLPACMCSTGVALLRQFRMPRRPGGRRTCIEGM
jgi:hypothetical protein